MLLENRIVDDRRLGQQLGNFRLSGRYYVLPGEHCKDADQTIGDQLGTKMTTDSAVMRTTFI